MKNKDLKKLLKLEASKIEVKDFSKEIIDKTNHQVKMQEVKVKNHKPFLGVSLTLALSLCLIFVIFLLPRNYGGEKGSDMETETEDKTDIETPKPVHKKVNFEEAYDQSALSGISLLANNSSSNIPVSRGLRRRALRNKELVLNDNLKKELIENLLIAQNTLNGGFTKSEEVKSDLKDYDFMYTLTGLDLNLKEVTYTFYYKEVSSEVDEEEVETKLEGIVITSGVTYQMVGEKSIEEDEESYTYQINYDINNYVIVEEEIEGNETEFSYKTYQNGKCILETEVEYEIDEQGEISLGFSTEKDGIELEYEYKFINSSKGRFVEVEFENNEEELETYIKITTNPDGTTHYEFVDNID